MLLTPPEAILAINAAFLLIAGILAILLIRTGVQYVHSVGDSPVQNTQKKIILALIVILLLISLLAAVFNIIISTVL